MSTGTPTSTTTKHRRRITDHTPSRRGNPWLPLRWGSKLTGVDIGSRFAKLVSCHRHGNSARIYRADRIEIPEGGLADPSALADWLIPWLDADDDRSREINVTLPSCMLDQETQQIESAPDGASMPAQLAAEASRAAEALLGSQIEHAVYDAWLTQIGTATQLHLVWTNRQMVTDFARLLRRGFWNCRCISTTIDALALASQAGPGNPTSQLIIDLGCSPSIVWCQQGTPTYMRNKISLPHNDPVALLSEALKIRYSDAVILLRDEGLTVSKDRFNGTLSARITESLEPYLDGLLFEIGRTMQYLERLRRSSRPVDELILCGGAAGILGLTDWIVEHTGLTTRWPQLPIGYRWASALPYAPDFSAALALTYKECIQ